MPHLTIAPYSFIVKTTLLVQVLTYFERSIYLSVAALRQNTENTWLHHREYYKSGDPQMKLIIREVAIT